MIKIGKIVYLGEENELKNRYLLVAKEIQSAKEEIPKGNICTLNCTLEETAVLQYLQQYPTATQKVIANHIGKSERTIKTITANLVEKGFIERKNGKRNGFWDVKTN